MKTSPEALSDEALSQLIGESAAMRRPTVAVEGVFQRMHRFNELYGALPNKPDHAALIFRELASGRVGSMVIGPRLVVGRSSASSGLSFPDSTELSRSHFEIAAEGGFHLLHDLGSRNGTFLNEGREPLSDRVVLTAGDILFAGGIVFAFTGE